LKYIEDSIKHFIEESVRQVGHLPELYEDAQSEKYIKKKSTSVFTQIWGNCQMAGCIC